MVKILVADSTVEFCEAVADAFYDKYQILTCSEGRSTLKLICAEKPDILWLDVMLPGMDGLTILQAIAMQGVFPKVIACIRNPSDYVLHILEDCAVSMVMQKPCDLTAALARIDSLATIVTKERGIAVDTLDQLIHESLLLLQLSGKRCGHKCLFSAVRIKVLDPQCQITKILYPQVASECGGSAQSVERAIRCVVAEAWEGEHHLCWELYFPEYVDRCPSNGVVLERLADKIRMIYQNEKK